MLHFCWLLRHDVSDSGPRVQSDSGRSSLPWVYVDSCWFNGNIPWNLGLKNIGLIYDRYLQSIGSCCMAIDWLGVPNYGLKRLPLKSFWNVHLYCGLPTTRMFLGCLFFLGNNTKVSRSLPATLDVQSLVFAQSSLFGVYGVMFFFLSACARIISIHLSNFSKW